LPLERAIPVWQRRYRLAFSLMPWRAVSGDRCRINLKRTGTMLGRALATAALLAGSFFAAPDAAA
jgi:hypothetical protein